MENRNWSPQQEAALGAVAAWRRAYSPGGQQIFRIFGYAGTGKTTLARHFSETFGGEVCYAAFTGKAALMMQRSGCRDASTIHSLIYQIKPRRDGSARFVLDRESPASRAGLIVVDECSMVDEDLARDLLSFRRPILVLGDPAQLPPVKGAGVFTQAEPDVMLTEIHRQAAENPIIQMATTVREGGALRFGNYGDSRVVARGSLSEPEVLAADQILVGKNATRLAYNRQIRRLLGRESALPEVGDRLVCLRNDKTAGIFNGGLFDVIETGLGAGDPRLVEMVLRSDDFQNRPPFPVRARQEFFTGGAEDIDWRDLRGTQQFNYGNVLTTHKAQGSQWPDVIIYDESGVFGDDWRRWLYTAITRASERVTVVG